MKKIFVAITTLAMVLIMSTSSLFGCKLITTNSERDMNQIVATVQIDSSAPKEIIYKKDIVSDYYTYAYEAFLQGQVVNNLSDEIFSALTEQAIKEIVMVQYAMKYFAESGKFGSIEDEDKWKLETYLSDDKEEIDAKYDAYREFDSFIKDFQTDADYKVGDTFTGTIRAVPTGAKNDTEISTQEKSDYIERYRARLNKNHPDFDNSKYNDYVKAINQLKLYDLLGDYKNNNLETIEYFKDIEQNYKTTILLSNFQKDFESKYRLGFEDGDGNTISQNYDYSDIRTVYNELYLSQSNYSDTDFESALTSISAETPILKGREGYGMVYHILLKPDALAESELKELQEEYGDSREESLEYRNKRAKIFSNITAQDQRSSWIQAHYDFDGTKFTGDYTMLDDSLEFKGKTTLINGGDIDKDDYRAKYRVDSVNEFTLEEFIELVYSYVYGENKEITINENDPIDSRDFTASNVKADYDKRIKELIFAFSQDDSEEALNTYKGYEINIETAKKVYEPEFGEQGIDLVTKKDKTTFKVVATDFGYHIMFYSENFADVNYESLEEYLTSQYGIVNTENKYLRDQGFDAQATTIEDFISNWGEDDYIGYWNAEYNAMLENWDDFKDTKNYLYVLQYALASDYINSQYQKLEQEVLQIIFDATKVVKYKVY